MTRDIDSELQKMWQSAEDHDPRRLQRIPRSVIEEMKELLKMSTGQIAPYIVERLRRVDAHEQKIVEHDGFIAGLAKKMTEGFSGLIHLDEKLNGRK